MKILFDQGTPVPLRRHLRPHAVDATAERGWSTMTNGDLLNVAERAGYEIFVTTDQNLRHQQKLPGRKLGVIVLMSTSWPRIQRVVSEVSSAISRVAGGGYEEIKV